MKYVHLKKVFHINEDECNDLYNKRFNGESTKRIDIVLNNGYECFYLINDEILLLIDRIYEINTWLEKTMSSNRLPKTAQNYLIVSSLIEEIKSSNQMEGIYSTRKELKEMIIDKNQSRHKRFYGMVNKYTKLWKEDFHVLNSVSEIRKLYDEVLLEDILLECEKDKPDGVLFRQYSVDISSGTKIIHKGVYGEENIINLLEKSLNIINDENIHFLIKTPIFHYLFEYIHPFYNGNGRMGRFLVCGYLSKHMNILSALQFSIACLNNHKKYYDAFALTNDIRNKGDLTVFIIYFLEVYLSGLRELKEKTENTINTYDFLIKKIESYVSSKYVSLIEIILQITLFGVEGISMSQLVKASGYTEQSIRSIIKSVNKDYNIIEIDNTQKPYKYTINIDVVSTL